jgi:hypothetical protein
VSEALNVDSMAGFELCDQLLPLFKVGFSYLGGLDCAVRGGDLFQF